MAGARSVTARRWRRNPPPVPRLARRPAPAAPTRPRGMVTSTVTRSPPQPPRSASHNPSTPYSHPAPCRSGRHGESAGNPYAPTASASSPSEQPKACNSMLPERVRLKPSPGGTAPARTAWRQPPRQARVLLSRAPAAQSVARLTKWTPASDGSRDDPGYAFAAISKVTDEALVRSAGPVHVNADRRIIGRVCYPVPAADRW